MAPRQTARRLLVAAPALALAAFAVTACSPPNEQPADPDAPYTLPTYSEEPQATETEETTTDQTGDDQAGQDEAGPEGQAGLEGQAGVDGAEGVDGEVMPGGGLEPGVEVPVEGQQAPLEGLPAEQPAP